MALFGKKEKPPVWVQKTHLLQADEFVCSVCGFKAKKAHKVCPQCGAKPTKVEADCGWVDEAEWFDMME